MAIQDRLQTFIRNKELTPRLFENYAGLGNGSCAKINAKSRKATFDRIAKAFPTLNIDWLLTGEGEMLRPNGISQSGEQNNIHGNNIKGSGEGELGKALDEIAAQRKLTEKAQDEIAAQQRLTEKAQEQTDRLLSIIERMQQGN